MPSNRNRRKTNRAMPSRWEIFKLQRELRGGDLVLAYNKDRSVFGQFPMTEETRKLFGDAYKIYVLGRRMPDGKLETGTVPLEKWEDW